MHEHRRPANDRGGAATRARLLALSLALPACGSAVAPAPTLHASPSSSPANVASAGLDPSALDRAQTERCTLEGSLGALGTTVALHLAWADHALYVLDEAGEVRRFRPGEGAACVLTQDASFASSGVLHTREIVGVASAIAADAAGRLFVSGSTGVARFDDGTLRLRCASEGPVAIAPSGTEGLAMPSWQTSATAIHFGAGSCTASPWTPDAAIDFGATLSFVSEDRVTIAAHGARIADGGGRAIVALAAPTDGDGALRTARRAIACGDATCLLDVETPAISAFASDGTLLSTRSLLEARAVDATWPIDMSASESGALWVSLLEQPDPATPRYVGAIVRVTSPESR